AGPNLDAYRDMLAAVDVPVFASGGVTTLDNVRDLARLGLSGCVIGRALYEGQLDLKQVIECVRTVCRHSVPWTPFSAGGIDGRQTRSGGHPQLGVGGPRRGRQDVAGRRALVQGWCRHPPWQRR